MKSTTGRIALAIIVGAFVLILFVMLFCVIIVLIHKYMNCKNEKEGFYPKSTVLQYDGKDTASYILQGLNDKVDPCIDFYDYACGNWSRNNPTPPGHRLYDTLTKLQHEVVEKLYAALRTVDSTDPSTSNSLRKVKYVFDSCVNLVHSPDVSQLNPLLYLLKKSIMGMWPLLVPDWQPTQNQISISGLTGMLAGGYAVPTIITPMFSVDWKNVTLNRLYLDQAHLVLGDRSVYLNNSEVTMIQYRGTIKAAAEIMAHDLNINLPDDAVPDITDMVNFEKSLARIMSPDRSFEVQYNPYTIFQLKADFPNINWDNYLYYLLPTDVYRRVFPWVTIVLTNPDYFHKLNNLLGKVEEKIVYNYLIWQMIYRRMWSLSENYRDIHTAMIETVDLRWEVPSQRVQCISLTTDFMGFAMGRLYVDHYHNHTNFNHSITPMVDHMMVTLKNQLWNTPWMDLMTKEHGLRKIRDVRVNSGYPQWILDDQQLDSYYQNLSFYNNDGFFEVYNRLSKWKAREEAYKLLQHSVRDKFYGESPVLVNAWYSPEYNTLTLPIGLLQAPVVDQSYPPAVKYGSLGTILGHELMHGFDDQGVNFGPEGQLGRWLDRSSMRGFNSLSKCVVGEYSHFCYPEINKCVNGEATKGENIADNGGIKMAYWAYKRSQKDLKMTPIPGLEDFTEDQLFFLSYAGVWCGTPTDPEITLQLLLRNSHPPEKVRVLGTLRSFQPFSNAFDCPSGSPMVSHRPCTVW